MTLVDLPFDAETAPEPDGATYDPVQDRRRLAGQCLKVWAVMRDQDWRTLAELATATGSPEASVSARLRDLRKPRFGGHVVERRRRTVGQWEYRLLAQPWLEGV